MFSPNFYVLYSDRFWVGLLLSLLISAVFFQYIYVNIVLTYFYGSLLNDLDCPRPTLSRSFLEMREKSG